MEPCSAVQPATPTGLARLDLAADIMFIVCGRRVPLTTASSCFFEAFGRIGAADARRSSVLCACTLPAQWRAARRAILAWWTRLSTHVHTFFVRRGPPEIIEITARDHCPTARRSSPHSPLPSSAPQLASPHSPRPACRSSSSALVVSPSLSLALSCMSVAVTISSKSRQSRQSR